MSEAVFTTVARLADVPSGEVRKVVAGDRSILLCHSQDRIFAIENKCSHADEALECGRMRQGWISCPAHGARFELASGRAMNPPAKEPIRTFEVRIDGDVVQVALG
ncbi:Rieske (2Fe-2S) protein [Sphingomonas tabacisoli]|uniref:Rieske (2Fe-2S) protein n=1 Tax=Sphingomonas tabacisoli TaxID=2249466 RepID=A0ABW4I219_9SPHN